MASKFMVIRQERHDLKVEALRILDISPVTRTAQQTERLMAIEAAIPKLDVEIARMSELMEADRRAPGPGTALVQPARGRRYAELFPNTPRDLGGWNSADEFLACVHQGLSDPRLAFSPGGGLHAQGTVSVPSSGGFSVPSELAATWLDASLEDEVVRPRARVYAMTSNNISVPGFDGSDHTSTLYGGFAGGFVGEGVEITPEHPRLRLINLQARKVAAVSEFSNELASDGQGYVQQLSGAITKALGFFLDLAFLSGSGASQPLGVLSSPALIVVPKENAQTSSTVHYFNLVKAFSRMAPASVKNSVWVAHPSTIPQLSQLSIPLGTSGSHIPVMSDTDGSFKILTRPVLFTEKVPALGIQGDIGLYDFSQYAIALRADMVLDRSSHVGFTRDTQHMRAVCRADGQPTWIKPMTLKGAFTVSPYVVVEART
jgi:HK97 family phage major capsid protein